MLDEHPLQYISIFPTVNIKKVGTLARNVFTINFQNWISKTLTAKLPISMMKTICKFIIYYRFQINNYKTLT